MFLHDNLAAVRWGKNVVFLQHFVQISNNLAFWQVLDDQRFELLVTKDP